MAPRYGATTYTPRTQTYRTPFHRQYPGRQTYLAPGGGGTRSTSAAGGATPMDTPTAARPANGASNITATQRTPARRIAAFSPCSPRFLE
jgi:hypothetical protein